jgi:hypothetical protein
MKYFRLNNAFEKKDVGKFPGLKDCIFEGDRFAIDSFDAQGRDSRVIGNPALPFPEMHKSVKMTDLINIIVISPLNYKIVTERFLNFLKPYIKSNYQTWKINVKKGDIIYDYYILHIDNPKKDFINYSKTIFKLFKINDKYKFDESDQVINIIDDKQYFETVVNYSSLKVGSYSLKPTKITLNVSNNDEDLFRCISAGYFGYYVSEKLKNEIEKQGFTGIIFEELDMINNLTKIEII